MASAVADFLSLTQTTPQSIGRTDLTCKACETVLCSFLETIAITYIVYISFCTIWSKSAYDSDGWMPKVNLKWSLDLNMETIIYVLYSSLLCCYNRYTTHWMMYSYIVQGQIQFVCICLWIVIKGSKTSNFQRTKDKHAVYLQYSNP